MTEIMQLYLLRSTISYVQDWSKKSIIATYIVDRLMQLDLWHPANDYTKPEDTLDINTAAGWSLTGVLHNSYHLIQKGRCVTKENLDAYQEEINRSIRDC